MGSQDNTQIETARADIVAVLNELGIFKEIGDTPVGPGQVGVYPSAYYSLAEASREAADVQHVLHKTQMAFNVWLYVHDTETQGTIAAVSGLIPKLLMLLRLTIDAFDVATRGKFLHESEPGKGYLMEVIGWDSDQGTLAMSGTPIGMVRIDLLASLPPKQA